MVEIFQLEPHDNELIRRCDRTHENGQKNHHERAFGELLVPGDDWKTCQSDEAKNYHTAYFGTQTLVQGTVNHFQFVGELYSAANETNPTQKTIEKYGMNFSLAKKANADLEVMIGGIERIMTSQINAGIQEINRGFWQNMLAVQHEAVNDVRHFWTIAVAIHQTETAIRNFVPREAFFDKAVALATEQQNDPEGFQKMINTAAKMAPDMAKNQLKSPEFQKEVAIVRKQAKEEVKRDIGYCLMAASTGNTVAQKAVQDIVDRTPNPKQLDVREQEDPSAKAREFSGNANNTKRKAKALKEEIWNRLNGNGNFDPAYWKQVDGYFTKITDEATLAANKAMQSDVIAAKCASDRAKALFHQMEGLKKSRWP